MTHANAPLTPTGRLRMVQRHLNDGIPQAHVAAEFRVSRPTVATWVARYRAEGQAGPLEPAPPLPRPAQYRDPGRNRGPAPGAEVVRPTHPSPPRLRRPPAVPAHRGEVAAPAGHLPATGPDPGRGRPAPAAGPEDHRPRAGAHGAHGREEDRAHP
ncbi:hypothetical protein MICRO11B_290062 [Micrococcus luteus]|nr:hypothetical protein MICRO11B_290062 [Micrococcus luteus]